MIHIPDTNFDTTTLIEPPEAPSYVECNQCHDMTYCEDMDECYSEACSKYLCVPCQDQYDGYCEPCFEKGETDAGDNDD